MGHLPGLLVGTACLRVPAMSSLLALPPKSPPSSPDAPRTQGIRPVVRRSADLRLKFCIRCGTVLLLAGLAVYGLVRLVTG